MSLFDRLFVCLIAAAADVVDAPRISVLSNVWSLLYFMYSVRILKDRGLTSISTAAASQVSARWLGRIATQPVTRKLLRF